MVTASRPTWKRRSSGRRETVELLAAERKLHRETREILLAQAEAAIRHVDATVILRDLLRAA